MSSQKQKKKNEADRGGVQPNPFDNSSASVGYVDVRVREQTKSQTRVLFTSGAVGHYNGVNEEQMQLGEERGVGARRGGDWWSEVWPVQGESAKTPALSHVNIYSASAISKH